MFSQFHNTPPPPMFSQFQNTPPPPSFNNAPSHAFAPMYYPPSHTQQVPYTGYNPVQQVNTVMSTTPEVHRDVWGDGNGPRNQRERNGGRERGRENNKGNGNGKGFRGDGSARDLAMSKAVMSRFGVKMPQGKEDIEKWIAERKKNWPSKRNVERKRREREEKDRIKREEKEIPKEDYGESLADIANIYSSSSEEGEVKEDRQKTSKKRMRTEMEKNNVSEVVKDGQEEEGELVKGQAVDKGRSSGKGKKNHKRQNKRRRRGNARNKGGGDIRKHGMTTSKMSLMRKLLDDEIQKEAAILFQAFQYLAQKDRDQTLCSSVDGCDGE